jgi:hypothetical protein
MMLHSVIVATVAKRNGCPDKQPSPKKSPFSWRATTRFLSLFGYYADLDLAFLKVKDRIRRVALPKNLLPLSICRNGPAAVHDGQKCIDVKGRFFLRFHKQLSRSIGDENCAY